ncbi:hypothetical protein TIFTF001_015533 [Ficus carica]|uniref:DUF8039 domain-containing protein n=1 Tax=Ficus carica TaxID=3494 RepID=A0AA88DIN5_FICCA|nr:hypothetical protein TIFTF001_015533 [Ficus carica]
MSQNTMEDSKKGRVRRKNPLDPNVDGKRRATMMKQVHMARKRSERIEVTFDEKGQPEGKHGDELMSWIGVLAREHIPIWIQDWRFRDLDRLKEIIWKETITSFTYRTSSQFQQLLDRGSEIWTNNEYSLRGGRDRYRKLYQEKFKKNGKWEKRDGLWLDSRTGSDGELKDPACKKVSELIIEYNTQESQGTFESVGTSDVLTQALSRAEHPGRIRGQSKFVKQSQYFNLNRSSNRDNEVQSMRREIEELKALVRGLCTNKDVEPSFDQENVPIVDQHNSYKASCSVQEKQHGVSNPPTMPVNSQEFHGIPLGEGNVRMSINVPKLKKAALPIPTYEATTVEEAVNGFVAWPKTLVELDTSMNKASRGPSHDAQQHEALFDFKKMNIEMRPLAYYAHSSMRQGNQIEVPIPYTIMGFDMPVFLSFNDIYEFINLQEISVNCILVYIRYLEELCRINGQAEKFVFVSPTLISPIRTDTEDAGMRERADSLVGFLRDAPKG